jgi:hypothetical protein
MNATTVAVNLAKNEFELAVADSNWKVTERGRLTRGLPSNPIALQCARSLPHVPFVPKFSAVIADRFRRS